MNLRPSTPDKDDYADLRLRALELAIEAWRGNYPNREIITTAGEFYVFLLGETSIKMSDLKKVA